MRRAIAFCLDLKSDTACSKTHAVAVRLKAHVTDDPRYKFTLEMITATSHEEFYADLERTGGREDAEHYRTTVQHDLLGRESLGSRGEVIDCIIVTACDEIVYTTHMLIPKALIRELDERPVHWKELLGAWLKVRYIA